MTWTPPSEFEEYRIVRPLASGAMGSVFLAHDTLLERAVAIKFISAVEIGAAARERFFTEARAIARLSHPNVVGIHRIGEIRQRPYLVSEYVRGTSLDTIVKPVPWQRALKIAIGLARGLASAHRRNVLHRDIKPANVMLDDNDEPKLLDFGLAKLVETHGEPRAAIPPRFPCPSVVDETQSVPGRVRSSAHALGATPGLTLEGALVGTPLYLAPELWRGESATRRTDVYGLGVVLYELISGRAPHAGLDFDELSVRAQAEDPAPIANRSSECPSRFAEVIDACVARDPSRRPETGDVLRELLEAVIPQPVAPLGGSPYRGLSAFEPEHRALFFGRSEETRAVVERLRSETIVVVAGDSGAGKSSLCRAAILPAITEGAFAGRRWRVVTLIPGPHPLASLNALLAVPLGDDGLVLFVDQLEELLTLSDPAEAAAVAERIAELVVASSNTRVLASARSDFLGRLAALPGLGDLIGHAMFLLGPISERGLRDAIVGPARALGYEIPVVMVEELIASGRHLPLLQFTLAELWDTRDDKARRIPDDALAQIGGVGGALARRADQVMAALGDVDRELAWRVLVRLMTAEGTRAVITRGELGEIAGDRAAVERVVERLVAARLLVVAAGGDDRVEVVHEALFTAWPRFVEWRQTHEHGTRMRDLHAEAARRWNERGRQGGLLWRGEALAEYRAWRRRWPEPPTSVEAAFDLACDADARRTRRVRATLLAIVVAALSIGIVVLYRSDRRAARERDVAEDRRADAERQRRMLYVEQGLQELTQGHSERALPYLVQALREGDTSPSLRFLLGEAIRPLDREVATIRAFDAGVADVAWSPDGSLFAASGRDNTAAMFDRDGKQVRAFPVPPDPYRGISWNSVAFSPDGAHLIAVRGRIVQVWNVATGALAFELRAHTEDVVNAAYDRLGARISTISTDGTLRFWDARSGAALQTIDVGRASTIGCQGLDADGSRVAIGLSDGSLRMFDTSTGKELFRIAAAMSAGCRIEMTSDRSRLLTNGLDVRLWDARTHELVALVSKGITPGATASIAVTADGRQFATGGPDGIARVWDAGTGALVHHLVGHTSAIRSLRFSADSSRLASSGLDRTFRVWDLRGGVLESTFEAATTSPTIGGAMTLDAPFSHDGTRLLTAVGSELRIMRTTRDGFVREIEVRDGPTTSATLSPDERSLAIAGLGGHLEVWNLERRQRTTASDLASGLWDISWSKDGSELLVAGKDGLAQLLSATGEPIRRLDGHDRTKAVNRAAFSPDGARIVTASSDNTARVWDAPTARQLRVLAHDDRVMAATWSPDGTRIATSCWQRGLHVWDAASGTLLFVLRDDALRFLDVTFSPDGTQLAATTHSGLVTIWDLATKQRTRTLIGHTGPTATATWSPDGTMIASSSSDMTARVWDVATGRVLATRVHGGEALQVTWNRAGTQIVVATPIPGVRIWEVGRERRSVDELVELVRSRVRWKLVEGRLEVLELSRR